MITNQGASLAYFDDDVSLVNYITILENKLQTKWCYRYQHNTSNKKNGKMCLHIIFSRKRFWTQNKNGRGML